MRDDAVWCFGWTCLAADIWAGSSPVILPGPERTIKAECGWRGRGGICCDAQADVFPIVAAAAKPVVDWLAGALVGVVARVAGDKLLGTPQQRAIHAACEAAVERAVHDVSAAGASEEDIVHALALTQRLVGLRDLVDLKAAGSTRQRVPLAEWQQRFDELGYDPQTFPVSFEQLVDRITVYLQEELRAHARDRGSPLFGSAVLDDLDVVISTVREIARVFQGWSVARLLPLSAAVKSALDGQRGHCEAIGRPFFTPDLLLALLTMPGRVAQCFDEAEPASAGRVRSQLLFYTARLPAGTAGGFVPFDWVEREDVLCRAKTRKPALSWCFLRSLGCSPVLADQALDGLSALDPGGHVDRLAGLVQRRSLCPRLVGPVIVVVLGILSQDLPEVPFAVDQQMAGALAT